MNKQNNKKTTYRFMWGQKQSAMFAEIMILNFAIDNNIFSITKDINDVIREQTKGYSYIYFSNESIESGYVNGKVYEDKKEKDLLFKKIDTLVIDSTKFFRSLRGREYAKVSNNELIQLLKKCQYYIIYGQKYFRASDPSATKIAQDKITDILKQKLSDEEIIEEFITLTTPIEFDKPQLELMDFEQHIVKGETSDKELLELALKYPANYVNTWEDATLINYLKKRIDETDIKELHKQIVEIKSSKKALRVRQVAKLKKYNNKELNYFTALLRRLAIQRFELKHSWAGGEVLSLDFWQHFASLVELDTATFMETYNFIDAFNFLKDNIKLTNKEIKERQDYSVIHYKDESLTYLYGDKAKKYFSSLYNPEFQVNELKGVVASTGKARGKVRIVKVSDLAQFIEDQKLFQKGEVLITTMTSPIMMPIASKASAIVTNEGGITSHAAVISREFKVPCIVGTHDATNVFKTGDVVEVDAYTGIIKILKTK